MNIKRYLFVFPIQEPCIFQLSPPTKILLNYIFMNGNEPPQFDHDSTNERHSIVNNCHTSAFEMHLIVFQIRKK